MKMKRYLLPLLTVALVVLLQTPTIAIAAVPQCKEVTIQNNTFYGLGVIVVWQDALERRGICEAYKTERFPRFPFEVYEAYNLQAIRISKREDPLFQMAYLQGEALSGCSYQLHYSDGQFILLPL